MHASPSHAVLLLGAVLVLLLVVGLVALIVLLASRNRHPAPPLVLSPPPAPVPQEDRQAILRQLAQGELTKEEAEEQLSQLGTPVLEVIE